MSTRPLTRQEQVLVDRERLAVFIREIKRYKTLWGMPPDKIAFRDAWRATQELRGLAGRATQPQRENLSTGVQHDPR